MSERISAVTENKAAPAAAGALARPSLTPARSARLQRACACGQGKGGQCNECDKEKKQHVLQLKSNGGPQPASTPAVVNDTLSSPGRPLDNSTRTAMESRFGHDFSSVRIHDDSLAASSASAVNARAYTVGQDIAFASGQFDPHSHSGRHLLAHELAHTIQQSGLHRSSNGSGINTNHDAEYQRLEHEADTAAAAVTQGETPTVMRSANGPMLSRTDDGTVAPAKSTVSKPAVMSNLGGTPTSHTVTPTEVYTAGSGQTLEEFEIDSFYMPATKGANALAVYDKMATGGSLESTVTLQGTGKTRTALWQERPGTEDLRTIWTQKVGWVGGNVDDLWSRCGGDAKFPHVGGVSCHMDHIVELQIGGNNAEENIQTLDATPNMSSGSAIKNEVQALALAIAKDPQLSSGTATQFKMRFKGVKQVGTPDKLPVAESECPVKAAKTCLKVEACAKNLKVVKSDTGEVSVQRINYPVNAGGRETNFKVPVTFAGAPKETVTLATDTENNPASTLIPGLVLTQLGHRKGTAVKPDTVDAKIDAGPDTKTRLPISVDPAAKPLHLTADAAGKLTLDPALKSTALGFTYKYLSGGKIKSISVDSAGETTWTGTITPSVPFIGELGVEYSKGSLMVTKGLDEAALKKKSVLGMRITKAQLQLALAPEFKPSGVLEMEAGPAENPIAKASMTVEADAIGLIATGKLNVNIPKMKTAESVFTYKGGEGRNVWDAKIDIKSEDINLGSITVTGGFQGTITKDGINFTGKVMASLPGDNKAELGLQKKGDEWILFGTGTFAIPKLDETKVTVTYHLGTGKLVATGQTGFTIPSLNLRGRLDSVTFTYTEGAPLKVYGKGGLDFKRGKAEGHVDVELHSDGNFSGKGSLTYKIKENLIVTGTVELSPAQKLRITGEVLIPRYELFKQYGDTKDLFKLDIPVPVPGLSIGTSGLVFKIGGGVTVAYSFGPGAIEPLKFSAGFDPLEADPDLTLTVTGSVKVPASATLSAYITGALGVQIDVGIGSAGAEAGLKLQGDLILSAGAFANLMATYQKKRFSAKIEAGIEAKLMLGLSLSAFARAWAGAFGITGEIRKDWVLAQKKIDTQLGFYVKAPFEYADDTGIKLPEFKDIELRKPELTQANMKRILGEIFGSASETVKES